jgi:hypothetical protein
MSVVVGGFVNRLVEFPLEQGGSVLVEVGDPAAGPVTRGIGSGRPALAERADQSFQEAVASVTPAAEVLIAQLRLISKPPAEIGIEFGVQLSAQTGAFIASAAAAANFKVSMTWRGGAET